MPLQDTLRPVMNGSNYSERIVGNPEAILGYDLPDIWP
jgi:hypothetical protein